MYLMYGCNTQVQPNIMIVRIYIYVWYCHNVEPETRVRTDNEEERPVCLWPLLVLM